MCSHEQIRQVENTLKGAPELGAKWVVSDSSETQFRPELIKKAWSEPEQIIFKQKL